MPFTPPFCPHRGCLYNGSTVSGFARPHGRYVSRAARRAVPRFRCTGCRRTFSAATFRYSYRQKKPRVDAALVRLLCNGVSLRGAARLLGLNRKTVFSKLSRLARHSQRLHVALLQRRGLPSGPFQLDELETFESNRYQPVCVPVLIEKRSFFIVGTATAPLRRKGRLSPLQQRRRARHEAAHGRRPSQSHLAVRRCLAGLARHAHRPVVLESDRKASYRLIARVLLGNALHYRTTSSRDRRDRLNPLFPINHTNAMLRYGLARLRRRSWCVSRRRGWLQKALHVYAAWFNYCRGITNRTRVSPAQALRLARRTLLLTEWLGWRQDWHNAGRLLPPGLNRLPNPS